MATLDEIDLQVVHVLQIAPRASWARLAPALGVSESALAARWRRLVESGLAWSTVHANQAVTGDVTGVARLEAVPAARSRLRERLVADPRVVGVDESSEGEFFVTVMEGDLAALRRALLDDLPAHDGVTRVRSHVVRQVVRGGSDWRSGGLDREQREAVAALVPPRPARRPAPPPGADRLVAELRRDARVPVAEVARRTGWTAATTRRRLDQLIASDVVTFRCDVAHEAAQWPLTSTWFVSVAPADLPRTLALLASLDQVRLAFVVTGETNVVFSVLARSLGGVNAFHDSVGRVMPWLRSAESLLLLRSVKRMGWVLDDAGHRTDRLVHPVAPQAAGAGSAGR